MQRFEEKDDAMLFDRISERPDVERDECRHYSSKESGRVPRSVVADLSEPGGGAGLA